MNSQEIIASQKARYPWFRFYDSIFTPITSFVDACNKIRNFCPVHSSEGYCEMDTFGRFILATAGCGCWFTITGSIETPCRYFAGDSEAAKRYFESVKRELLWANDIDKLHRFDCRHRSPNSRAIYFDQPAGPAFSLCGVCRPSRVSKIIEIGTPMCPCPPVARFVLQSDFQRCLEHPQKYFSELAKPRVIKPPPIPTEDRLRVSCSCGAKLVAPPDLRGKIVACPKCNRKLQIPTE